MTDTDKRPPAKDVLGLIAAINALTDQGDLEPSPFFGWKDMPHD